MIECWVCSIHFNLNCTILIHFWQISLFTDQNPFRSTCQRIPQVRQMQRVQQLGGRQAQLLLAVRHRLRGHKEDSWWSGERMWWSRSARTDSRPLCRPSLTLMLMMMNAVKGWMQKSHSTCRSWRRCVVVCECIIWRVGSLVSHAPLSFLSGLALHPLQNLKKKFLCENFVIIL